MEVGGGWSIGGQSEKFVLRMRVVSVSEREEPWLSTGSELEAHRASLPLVGLAYGAALARALLTLAVGPAA